MTSLRAEYFTIGDYADYAAGRMNLDASHNWAKPISLHNRKVISHPPTEEDEIKIDTATFPSMASIERKYIQELLQSDGYYSSYPPTHPNTDWN